MPKLSVIIAAYNHEKYVRRTVESILNQTFCDIEVVAIDDGSTDKTPQILEEFAPDIRVIHQKNVGIVATRNKGYSLTNGEYICFIDSDDVIASDRFEKQIKLLDATPSAGLIYSDALIIDENEEPIGRFSEIYKPYHKNIAKNLFCRYCFIPAITVTTRRSVFDKTGPLWGPDRICDYLKWIEIALISNVAYIPEALGSWRRHSACLSLEADTERLYLEQIESLNRLSEKNPEINELVKRCKKKRYARMYFLIGFFAALSDDFTNARKYFRKSFIEFPYAPENVGGLLLSYFPYRKITRAVFQNVYNKVYKWK